VADAPPGLPGVQELLPAVLTGLRRRYPELGLDGQLSRIADLLADRPARLFGIAGRKGRMAVGRDADFVLLDPDAAWMLSAEHVQAKCGWSAYEGWTMTGRVDLTVRCGEIVWDRLRGTFGPPTGRWLDASEPPPELSSTQAAPVVAAGHTNGGIR
jgi:dihydroorotase